MIEVLFGNDDGTKIVRGLPPGTPCAHKTGEIDGVRNDAAIVDPFGDTPYVLVVLTKELRNQAAGNAGIAAIAHRVDAALRSPASRRPGSAPPTRFPVCRRPPPAPYAERTGGSQ